jgi:uncharacterized small protein (DUF1192 family)
MNNSLYNVSRELTELNNAITDVMDSNLTEIDKDALISQIFEDYLSVEERFDERIDWLAADSKRLKAQADACKAEAKRINQIAATYEAQAERIRQVILDAMQLHNKSKVNGTFCKLSIRKNAPKLVIDVGVDDLPSNLITVETTVAQLPNNATIKEHLQQYPDSRFAHYEQTQSLVIK